MTVVHWSRSELKNVLVALDNRRKNYIRRYALLMQEASGLLYGILNSIPKDTAPVALEEKAVIIAGYDTDFEGIVEVRPKYYEDWRRAVKLTNLARPLYSQLLNLEAKIAALHLRLESDEDDYEEESEEENGPIASIALYALLRIQLEYNPMIFVNKVVPLYTIAVPKSKDEQQQQQGEDGMEETTETMLAKQKWQTEKCAELDAFEPLYRSSVVNLK